MPHQHQTRVGVRLAPVPPAEPERRSHIPRRRDHPPEPRRVLVVKLNSARRTVHRPQVPQAVVVVEGGHPAPTLAQARRVDRLPVPKHRRASRSAVAQVRVAARAVLFAHPQPQPVVAERVGDARIQALHQTILLVIDELVHAPPQRQARLAAVEVVGVALIARRPARQLVVRVIGERLHQAPVVGLRQAVAVVVVGVGVRERHRAGPHLAHQLVRPVVAETC